METGLCLVCCGGGTLSDAVQRWLNAGGNVLERWLDAGSHVLERGLHAGGDVLQSGLGGGGCLVCEVRRGVHCRGGGSFGLVEEG